MVIGGFGRVWGDPLVPIGPIGEDWMGISREGEGVDSAWEPLRRNTLGRTEGLDASNLVGSVDTHIATVDKNGAALAALRWARRDKRDSVLTTARRWRTCGQDVRNQLPVP